VWVNYHTATAPHSSQLRFDAGSSNPHDCLVVLAAVLDAMDPDLYLITIDSAEFANDGSNVRNLVTWPGAGTYGSGAATGADQPKQVMFVGRDPTGHRWRLSVWGYKQGTPNIYRLPSATVATVASAIVALRAGITSDDVVSINNGKPLLKDYASFNFNNHWEANAR
jgi:hypothetical protein